MLRQLLIPFKGSKGKGVLVRAPDPSEKELQASVVEYLGWALKPGWIFRASLEGVWLGAAFQELVTFMPRDQAKAVAAKIAARSWADLKTQGAQTSWPDLELVSPESVWFGLELKSRTGRLTPGQKAFRADCEAAGRNYAVAHSFGEAEALLKVWGAIRMRGQP